MNAQPTDPNRVQVSIDQRLRTARTLWIALLVAIGFYYMVTVFAQRSEGLRPNDALSLALLVAGVATVLASFLLKNKLVNQAIKQRQVQNVQNGYLVAWVSCELAALLGLFDYFMTSHPHSYVLFIVAAVGDLFHYPRREHFEQASNNPPIHL